MCEMYNRTIEVYQYSTGLSYESQLKARKLWYIQYEGSAKCESSLNFYFSSAEPINIFHSSYKTDYEPIRLSYHNGVHYNAVLNPNKPSVGVGLGLSGYKPWVSEHCTISIFPSCHLIFPYTCKSVTLLIMC